MIAKAKEHYQYGINCDIFKEPVTSYARTALWAFEEVERLTEEVEAIHDPLMDAQYRIAELEKENAELNVELQSMRGAANSYKMHYEIAKADAVKEFAERLKEQAALNDYLWDEERVYFFQIDNLLAEMTDPTITKVEHNSLCETETYRKGG